MCYIVYVSSKQPIQYSLLALNCKNSHILTFTFQTKENQDSSQKTKFKSICLFFFFFFFLFSFFFFLFFLCCIDYFEHEHNFFPISSSLINFSSTISKFNENQNTDSNSIYNPKKCVETHQNQSPSSGFSSKMYHLFYLSYKERFNREII